MRRLIDLSHPVHAGESPNDWIPGPDISEFLTRDASQQHYAPGVTFAIHRVNLIGNSGTYLDSPFHRYEDGADLAGIPLAHLADLPGIVIYATTVERRAMDSSILPQRADLAGSAVLFRTSWARKWRTSGYAEGFPYVSAMLAERLVSCNVALVGVDTLNVDDLDDRARPAHSILLGAGIPIVENLCALGELPESGFRFSAVPARIAGCSAFPVRAFAVV